MDTIAELKAENERLRKLLEDSPVWPGTDVSVEEVLVFLGHWYGWRERMREALAE